MTQALEVEDEIVPQLELDEETLVELDSEEETEAPKARYQNKKERKRLILLDSVYALVDMGEEFSSSKKLIALLPDADHAKEFLNYLRERKPTAPRTPLSVGNIAVAYKVSQTNRVQPDFILIHLDLDLDFLNEACKIFSVTKRESEEISNAFIKKDANRELCRKCKEEEGPDSLPYGEESGLVEWKPQFNSKGEPMLDDEGNQLYVEFPELTCEKGHRWYKGEGARRNVKGKNPILLDSHYKMRQQREIYVDIGTPDPAYTRDRFDRPTKGIFIRTHPSGRKTNTEDQRKKSGASFYR